MERLRDRDVARIVAFAYRVGSASTLAEFGATIASGLDTVIANDIASYTEVSRDPPSALAYCYPDVPERVPSELARLAGQHPLITRSPRESGAETISDYLTRRQFRSLELYTNVYRLIDAEDQIAINLPAPAGRAVGVAMNRDRATFTPRERATLNLLRPLLLEGHRRVRARERLLELRSQAEPPGTEAAVIVLAQNRTIEYATPQAHHWLHAHFRTTSIDELPDPLITWLDHDTAPTLTSTNANGRLRLQRTTLDTSGTLLIELHNQPSNRLSSLTRREREILEHVADGSTNAEIAATLTISQRTVEHHLEHAYRKLNVHTRTAATKALQQERTRAAETTQIWGNWTDLSSTPLRLHRPLHPSATYRAP